MIKKNNKIRLVLFLSILVFAFSCKKKLTNTTELNYNNIEQSEQNEMKHTLPSNCLILDTLSIPEKESIMRYIKRNEQRIVDARAASQRGYPIDIIYEENEIYQIFPVVNVWLKNQGYKHISDEIFISKIKSIYNMDISNINTETEKKNNYLLYISDIYKEPYGPHLGYTYFVKSGNFIFRPTLDEYFAQVGEDGRYYTCLKPSLLHQNKFLFNDNDASLTWLINNDAEFLEMLVKDFGYDKNTKINEAVLNKIYKEYSNKNITNGKNETLIGLFANKKQYGNFEIRTKLMEYISDKTTKEDNKYLLMLENFGTNLISARKELQKIREPFTEEERLRIVAYITFFSQKAYDKHWEKHSQNWPATSLLYGILSNEDETTRKFLQQTKEKQYYGLENFENMINYMLEYIENE